MAATASVTFFYLNIAWIAHYKRHVQVYECLKDEDYVHLMVNHSHNFRGPENREYVVGSETNFTLYRTIKGSFVCVIEW